MPGCLGANLLNAATFFGVPNIVESHAGVGLFFLASVPNKRGVGILSGAKGRFQDAPK
jgi:hypothetical protein